MKALVLIACIFSSLISITTGGNVRLVSGADEHSGMLQVLLGGTWGPVCDDGFGYAASTVVCRELEYTDLSQSTFSTVQGTNNDFHMDNVECTGAESSIIDCFYAPIDNCGFTETIYISCASAGGDGCLQSPPCSTPARDCPYGETEVVSVSRTRCPICRCATCPSQPSCPTNCKSGRTEYFQDTLCRRCRCIAQDLPDVIEETATISTTMMVVICLVTLGIPVVILIVVVIIKRKKADKANSRKIRPRDPNLVAPKQNNWFAGGGVKVTTSAAMGSPMGVMVPPPDAMHQPTGVMGGPTAATGMPMGVMGGPPPAQMNQPMGVMGSPPTGVMDCPSSGNPMFPAMAPQN